MKNRIKGYYFITDSALSRSGSVKDAAAAARAGVSIIQYRDKTAPSRGMFAEASKIRKACPGVLLIVNDRIDIALAARADGVHIGGEDMPFAAARKLLGKNRIIGVTVHSVKEAKAAEKAGADYLGVSPIFRTTTKADAGRPAGVKLIRAVKKFAKIPVVAIGGINHSNAAEVIGAGADAICAISCVVTKENVPSEIRKFQELFLRHSKKAGNK